MMVDCIILAGDRMNYRAVARDNKAFLPIDGRSILEVMLEELAPMPEISRFLIVGPKTRLDALFGEGSPSQAGKPILLIDQTDDLVGNIMLAYEVGSEDADPDRPTLILPSDIPLITVEEMREFIGMCDMSRYDYVGGLTGESVLRRFYPSKDQPGVHLAYFYCDGEGYRINNLHMVRPRALGRSNNIRRVYGLRYQKRFRNAMQVIGVLVRQVFTSPGAVLFYFGLNMIYWMQLLGWSKTALAFSRNFKVDRLSHYISKSLDTRMKIVLNTLGGSTLDVDNEDDYRVIRARFHEWRQLQRTLAQAKADAADTSAGDAVSSSEYAEN